MIDPNLKVLTNHRAIDPEASAESTRGTILAGAGIYQQYQDPNDSYSSRSASKPAVEHTNVTTGLSATDIGFGRMDIPASMEELLRKQAFPTYGPFPEVEGQMEYAYSNMNVIEGINRTESEVWWEQLYDIDAAQSGFRAEPNTYPPGTFPFE